LDVSCVLDGAADETNAWAELPTTLSAEHDPGMETSTEPPVSLYLVEDSRIIVEVLTRHLTEDGNVVVVGTSGHAAQAIDELDALQPTLAIVDLLLASGTGYEVLRTLRARRSPIVPFILTGFAGPRDRAEALTIGVRDSEFFDKGRDIPRLVGAVRAFASRAVAKFPFAYRV
jgi:two-component system, NarL family, response regulator DevR